MLAARIRTIKLFFILLSGTVVGSMLLGLSYMHDNYLFSAHTLRTARAHIEYAIHTSRGNVGRFDLFAAVDPYINNRLSYRSRGGRAEAIPVLVYHGILDEPDNTVINTTEDNFKDQLFALKSAGYDTITTGEFYRYMRGEIGLPANSIMITFDDGRSDTFYRGDPYLSALDYQAVLFAITKYSLDADSTYYLSKRELIDLERTGRWDIQAHTHAGHESYPVNEEKTEYGHFYSHKLWNDGAGRLETNGEYKSRVIADIEKAQSMLGTALGKEIAGFTFPFGDFGQFSTNHPGAREVLTEAVRERFGLVFYQDAPQVRFSYNYQIAGGPEEESFMARRISVQPEWTGEDLLRVLRKSRPKPLPYIDRFAGDKGWVNAWGEAEIGGGRLVIRPRSPSQTGGATVLGGSRAWKDYEVTTTLESPNRNSAFVWVRFQDDDNNAACNFGEGFAHVEQVVDGHKRVIRGVRDPNFILPEGRFRLTARVVDRTVQCAINNEVMVETSFLDRSLSSGGVGYKTWDATLGKSVLFVHDITVAAADKTRSTVESGENTPPAPPQ